MSLGSRKAESERSPEGNVVYGLRPKVPLAYPADETNAWMKVRPALEQVVVFLGFLALGLIVSLSLAGATGHSPDLVLSDIFVGSIGSKESFSYTLLVTAPLLLVAVGAVITLTAGQFNIGQEGQVTLGAIGAGFIVFKIDAAPWIVITLALVAALVFGGIWAAIGALLKFTRSVDIVVTSLLMVFLAEQLMLILISGNGPLRDQAEGVFASGQVSQSPRVSESYMLSSVDLFGLRVPGGFLLALVLTAVIGFGMYHSKYGYRLRLLGHSPKVARSVGVRESRTGSLAVFWGGGFAGLAGALLLLGQTFQMHGGFSGGVGWDGLLIALAARVNAWLSIVLALIFGIMLAGGGLLGGNGVPVDIVKVMTACVVVALLCPAVAIGWIRRRRVARQVASV